MHAPASNPKQAQNKPKKPKQARKKPIHQHEKPKHLNISPSSRKQKANKKQTKKPKHLNIKYEINIISIRGMKMKGEIIPFEERTIRKTISFPMDLYNRVMEKLPHSQYATFSELVRDLVRRWVEEEN